MHRNVLSTSFRSGSLAIFPLAVGGLFLALSMHELRLKGILRTSRLQASPLGRGLRPSGRGSAVFGVPIGRVLAALVAWIRYKRWRLAISELRGEFSKEKRFWAFLVHRGFIAACL
jgi:hypothetical protein